MQQRNVGVEKVLQYKIFTMDNCIFCVRAKMLFNKHGASYTEKRLSGEELNRFKQTTKCDTLPQIYDANSKRIGGYTELCEHFSQGSNMLEALAISVLGSFFYDNLEFIKTVKEQKESGYQWEWN